MGDDVGDDVGGDVTACQIGETWLACVSLRRRDAGENRGDDIVGAAAFDLQLG